MRIPIFITLPLVLLTIGLLWWQGTKNHDFISPPNELALASVREKTMVELKATDSINPDENSKAIRVKATKLVLPDAEVPSAPKPPTLEPQDFGELTLSPALDCYLTVAGRGADVLTDLATQLELKGETQRALLAWERVLDAAPSTPEQQEMARKAISRLRPQLPLWNVDPLTSARIVLHISCDRDRAKIMEPILQEISASLSETSAGLIDCKLELQAGAKPSADKPRQPLALWLRGSSADSPTTKTLTIPNLPENSSEQKNLLLSQIYKLIRDSIPSENNLRPLTELPSGSDATLWLQSAITRRSWALWGQTFLQKTP